jgi:hypothetical protein
MLTRRRFVRTVAAGLGALLLPADEASAALARLGSHGKQRPQFHSRPDLDPPLVTVSLPGADPDPGYLFLASFYSPDTAVVSQYGPQIVDENGQTVWFQPLPRATGATAFRVQEYRGKPVLTWWEGTVLPAGYGQGRYVILDTSYRQIKTVVAGHGFHADLHEFLLTPDGTALITAYNPISADLSSIGGPNPGTVLDSVVQEIDLKAGSVLFEWHSWSSVGLAESKAFLPPPGDPYDHFHVNSIDVDLDGNLLVSGRNTSTVYKLDRSSGEIIWRLGGTNSDFTFNDGAAFGWQHDVRRRPDGTISMFDNGTDGVPGQAVERQSRGLVLDVDMTFMQASRSIDYVHPEQLVVSTMGNVQTLPTDDVFMGWGLKPYFSGFTAASHLTLDANLPDGGQSYRAFWLPWAGRPVEPPAVAVESNHDGTATVWASWNGATEVASWRVLVGASPSSLTPIHVEPVSGFETQATVRVRRGYVAVAALNARGHVIGTSELRVVA